MRSFSLFGLTVVALVLSVSHPTDDTSRTEAGDSKIVIVQASDPAVAAAAVASVGGSVSRELAIIRARRRDADTRSDRPARRHRWCSPVPEPWGENRQRLCRQRWREPSVRQEQGFLGYHQQRDRRGDREPDRHELASGEQEAEEDQARRQRDLSRGDSAARRRRRLQLAGLRRRSHHRTWRYRRAQVRIRGERRDRSISVRPAYRFCRGLRCRPRVRSAASRR